MKAKFMKREGGAIAKQTLFFSLGLLCFFLTHSLCIYEVPGFHYDEAWAAHFSHQIAAGELFWPVHAMSPYTFAWSHWITACVFRIFGTSLEIYRLTGVFFVFLGLLCLCCSLCLWGEKKAALLLPWLFAFFPTTVMNHRFSIEINTFHVFCFGLLSLGLSLAYLTDLAEVRRRRIAFLFVFLGIFFGVTSHILFIAPVIALWVILLLYEKKILFYTRFILLSLLPFFISILLNIPEKEKGIFLLLIWFFAFSGIGIKFFLRWRKKIIFFLFMLSLPSVGYILFFSIGHWNTLFNMGRIEKPLLIWVGFCSWFFPLIALFLKSISSLKKYYLIGLWFMLTLLWTSLIIIKQTPRYYELGLVCFLIVISLILSQSIHQKTWILPFLSFMISGAFQIKENYLEPGRTVGAVESSFQQQILGHFILRDSSTDFLSKQFLVRFLEQRGCTLKDIHCEDTRTWHALLFLSHSDWKKNKFLQCPYSPLSIDKAPVNYTIQDTDFFVEKFGFVITDKR